MSDAKKVWYQEVKLFFINVTQKLYEVFPYPSTYLSKISQLKFNYPYPFE